MGTAASSFLNPIAAELDGVGIRPTAQALTRRAEQRRQIHGMIGASYVVDAAVLLFLLTDNPIALPHGSDLEPVATMLVFILTIGRCMSVGMFSSSMKQSLYQSGQKLKEAYKRIEELAELDELTGSFNRRCIMRMLDEEIARAGRSASPCSIALIDLDWFKRINDAYGHPP